MAKYAIGVDFGTLSARALVAEIGTGDEVATATMDYPHAVMSHALPTGEELGSGWALQHPGDYIECLKYVVPAALQKAGIRPEDVIGVGIDCTASTFFPVDEQGTPLCLTPEFAHNPHAWAKLWKHHGAQAEANEMTRVAIERNEPFLARYGGRISSEWTLPKIWEILRHAPEVYRAADRFVEAGDWLVFLLTGRMAKSASIAGYKALWSRAAGYPSHAYLRALDPALAFSCDEKLPGALYPPGARAGDLTEAGARMTGLIPGTAVAVANIDAHVSMPATGAVTAGRMLMIMGTSTCDIMLADEVRAVPGMCGAVSDGVIDGLVGFEAGQSCVGDGLNWFIEHCVPERYAQKARARHIGLHELLTERAARLRPGESGLLALDWLNGNRSVLVDADLTGLILGLTLSTKPEEIYRSLIEATAFGARVIFETFEENGVSIRELVACGGIAKKNHFLMQIYANVLNREIRVARAAQAPALGAAMFGAVAAGKERDGYATIADAAREMGGVDETVFYPDREHVRVYDELYDVYKDLHDHFGRGGTDAMRRLQQLKSAR